MAFTIREMSMGDYEEALALWQSSEGVGLSSADTPGAIQGYLERNPGFSMVARDASGELAGAVLCGHDGRRGILHHLAVAPQARRQGLGRELVERCLACLKTVGIEKCHLFVISANASGRAFWEDTGWYEREALVIYSKDI